MCPLVCRDYLTQAAEELASLLPGTELVVAGSLKEAHESWAKQIDRLDLTPLPKRQSISSLVLLLSALFQSNYLYVPASLYISLQGRV